MSEFEIEKRQEYVRNRKKWVLIQGLVLALVVAIALGFFIGYYRMNRAYYIEYNEKSNIDYRVQYVDNHYFDDPLGKDRSYISSIIDTMFADFSYELNMQTNNVGFDCEYQICAVLLVADKDSGNPYYTTEEILLPKTTFTTADAKSMALHESVQIDFNKYHDFATEFIKTYNLTNASSTLLVTLDVEVLSRCPEFEATNENHYSTSLNVPLAVETFSVETVSSSPTAENKVLACSGNKSYVWMLVVGIVAACLAVALLIVLTVFLYKTKNEDVTYDARVRKVVNAYRSFIQEIQGDFDSSGYQVVPIKTFTEMLGVRDTLQAPILMSENRDETMTQFLIPTDAKLLYVYEIKVDNYDEIYCRAENPDPALT
ncbi:MAG: hypothetical protein IJV98_07455 [Clostridia bacterium]|nr:hypothetical protein [Clostridia bacterium]